MLCMKFSKRRRLDRVLVAGAAVLTGGAASIGALAGDTERIGNYWTHAALDSTGTAQVVEVIDYDFGPQNRRGILRNVDDLDPAATISVESPTAPDHLVVTGFNPAKLRIGDPNQTVSGRHRYRIEYPIDALVVADGFSWDGIGIDWTVPVNNAEVHVTAPFVFEQLSCDSGTSGSLRGCDVIQVEPGHLLVNKSGLGAREGVTIFARLGDPLGQAPQPPVAPRGEADDPGSGWLTPGLAGLGSALAGGALTSMGIRRLGREQVWEGGAADAAFGPPSGMSAGVRLMDYDELAEMSTIEFESPRDLSAAAGGIIHAEGVKPQHQIAWLIESAIRDEIVLDETGDELSLRRGSADPDPVVAPTLDAMFKGRDEVELGSYDKTFAVAWKGLGSELEAWRAESGLWDPAGHKHRLRARILGGIGAIIGLGITVLGGVAANRSGPVWIVLAAIGALLAGVSITAVLRSWELPSRTPEGSAKWLQIESFRRFIADSEARHAEAAARMGLLRQYTAWAVALGELSHWEKAVEGAAEIPDSAVGANTSDFRFVALAPALSSATAQTFTAPSSSGSGGGGGGSGGGGGGGGGGSW